MTNFTYNNNVPNPPNDPGDDVQAMNQNTQSLSGIIAQDHVAFNTANGGYHKVIHQPNQTINGQSAWVPSNAGIIAAIQATKISGVQQTFPLLYTPDTTGGQQDTQLFSMTGKGGVSQLTGNLATSDGWCWLGGVLLQWGSITGLSNAWPITPTDLNFKDRVVGAIPFPNNCFVVLTTFIGPTSASSADICIISKNATKFVWQYTGAGSTSYGGFSWLAIGN